MIKKHLSHLVPFGFFCILAMLLAIQSFRSTYYKNQLTEIYRGAVLSAIQGMESMEYNMNKALYSGKENSSAPYLTQLSDQAGQARRSLSLLPLSHPDTMQAIKLTNQLSDYAASLQNGQSISAADAKQLRSLIRACRSYAKVLYNHEEMLATFADHPASYYPDQETKAMDDALLYPTLIYDGPFSDHKKETPLPLTGDAVTWEEAARIAKACIGEERVLSLAKGPEILGPNPCHGITLKLDDITLEAAVTKKGGKVLWITPDNGAFSSQVTLEQCRESAQAFLQRNGFPPMECTSFQMYEGMAVLAFAALDGDILLYPDLVKVQCRMDTAQVVGLESKTYWQNRKERSPLMPSLSAREAEQNISSLLKVNDSRLCLIPSGEEEILCWQFTCTAGSTDVLVYINAATGAQEEILQVVESAAGIETV